MAKNPKKYARALFESYQVNELEAKTQSLAVFAELWSNEPSLATFFLNPSIKIANKEAVCEQICTLIAENDTYLLNFSRLLLQNKALGLIPEIAAEFKSLFDSLKKNLKLEINTASVLSDTEQQEIISYLKQDFGDLVSVNWKTEADIIGGFTAKAGDHLLDSSVKGALDKIKTSLLT